VTNSTNTSFYAAYVNNTASNGQGLRVNVQSSNATEALEVYSTASTRSLFRVRGNGSILFDGSAGTAGQVLQSNGSSAAPTWVTPSGGGGGGGYTAFQVDSIARIAAAAVVTDSANKLKAEKGLALRKSGDTVYIRDYCKTVLITSASSITINSDTTNMYSVSALAANLTINAPTGTPEDGRSIRIRIKDDGTSRTLTWNSVFREGSDFTLPTSTTAGKWLYVDIVWNGIDNKYDAVGKTNGF